MKRASIFILPFLFSMVSCMNIDEKKTTIEIEDNKRHYYPVLAGQMLDVVFNIKNTGDHPLIVTDIITSCGCLKVDGKSVFSIPPGKERLLTLSYNSSKNVGYVEHFVTLYGNFKDREKEELIFDVNVVPNALYTKDYEELYQEEKDKHGGLKDFVDGDEQNKGYYMDEDFSKSIHDNH